MNQHRSSMWGLRLVAVGALALTAAAVGSPADSVATRGTQRTTPAASQEHHLATVSDHNVLFYKNAGGTPLLAHAAGELGQRWLKITVVPRTLDLRLRAVCLWRGKWPPELRIPHFSTFVNGHRVKNAAGECLLPPYRVMPLEGTSALTSDTAARNKARWAHLGVEVGKPTQITLHMHKASGTARAQLAFGLYHAAPRDHIRGAYYQTKVLFKGHEYRAGRVKLQRFTGPHWVLSATLRGADRRYWILGGTLRAHQYGTLNVRPGGGGSIGTASPHARVSGVIRSAGSPARVTYRTDVDSATGLMWMVVYHETD